MKSALWMAAVALCSLIAGGIGACIAGCHGGVDVKKAASDVAAHHALLDKCKAEARDAGKVAAFDACISDAGAK